MRIVSLSPAATDWLIAFGAADRIAGAGGSDESALRDLKPDLVVTESARGAWGEAEVVAFDPQTFKQVLDAALRLGRAAGVFPEAMRVVAEGEQRLHALHPRLNRRDGTLAGRPTPTVVVLERLDPLMTAGRWVPDLVELAGGRAVCAEAGTPPAPVAWETLHAANPDVLVVAGRPDLSLLSERPGWNDLRAVRANRVHRFGDRPSLLHPGPSLYDAVERLAALLHPDLSG